MTTPLWTELRHPAPNARVTQHFGVNRATYAPFGLPGHEGVDLSMPIGTPVPAMHAGRVTRTAEGAGYGRQVWIEGQGLTSVYAHLDQWSVSVGQAVVAGQRIGLSGDTGHSTGPHLHVGLKIDGVQTAWKGWVDPALFWIAGVWRGSKLSYHMQKPSYPRELVDQVARANPYMIKTMEPELGPTKPFGDRLYVGRLYWNGEPDKRWAMEGAAGADRWWQEAEPRMNRAPWVRIWEGPNEVYIGDEAQADALAAFELRRVQLLHRTGRYAASLVFSTGNPFLSLWPRFGQVLAATDFLALHEYGMRTESPQMGETPWNMWHLYRHRKVIETLRENNCRVPPILITETGIDYGGGPTTDGWRAQGLSAEQFMAQLAAYEALLPPEVLLATPFTWTHQGWPSFDMGGKMSEVYTDYVAEQNAGAPIDWLAWTRSHKIRYNPSAALSRAISIAGLALGSQEFSDEAGAYQWGLDVTTQRWHLYRWTPTRGVERIHDEAVQA